MQDFNGRYKRISDLPILFKRTNKTPFKNNYIKPDFIFDNNRNLHGLEYKGIKILSAGSEELKHSQIIVIISNHSKDIYINLLELVLDKNKIKILN